LLTAAAALTSLRKLANKKKAKILQRFFKSGPGEYGEGDKFWGITVPAIRQTARGYIDLPLTEVRKLLGSPMHEARLLGLLTLVLRFSKLFPAEQKKVFCFYLKMTARINNWDLVDLSAPSIAGEYLADKDRAVLLRLARSKSLWERRIAIVATHAFIRRHDFGFTFKIARLLLADEQDLIHKAAGWMLREVGKRDPAALERFLRSYSRVMPRTMLRYAIERFSEAKRKRYLAAVASKDMR